MKTSPISKRKVLAARIAGVATACLILIVGSAAGVPVGPGGSQATGSCGVGAAQAGAIEKASKTSTKTKKQDKDDFRDIDREDIPLTGLSP